MKLSHSSSSLETSELQNKSLSSSTSQLREKIAALETENAAVLQIIAKTVADIKRLKESGDGLKKEVASSVSSWISGLGLIQLKWKLALGQAADRQKQVDVAFYSAKLADVRHNHSFYAILTIVF
jgi:hypothetical protein